jgi:predicted dehydrogenase
VAEAFSVPHRYADYRDLLANHALDIVSLALPPTANRGAAALAAFAGGEACRDF